MTNGTVTFKTTVTFNSEDFKVEGVAGVWATSEDSFKVVEIRGVMDCFCDVKEERSEEELEQLEKQILESESELFEAIEADGGEVVVEDHDDYEQEDQTDWNTDIDCNNYWQSLPQH